MTTDTTLTEPFDQQLYDAVMDKEIDPTERQPTYLMGFEDGYDIAASTAARIVAERAATVSSDEASDEELGKLIESTHFRVYIGLAEPDGPDPHTANRIAWTEAARTLRAALQPAPVVPEWVKNLPEKVRIGLGDLPPGVDQIRGWLGSDGKWVWQLGDIDGRLMGEGGTWQEAVQAACDAITKAEARS